MNTKINANMLYALCNHPILLYTCVYPILPPSFVILISVLVVIDFYPCELN